MTMLKILELAEDAALQRWDAARRDRIKNPTELRKRMERKKWDDVLTLNALHVAWEDAEVPFTPDKSYFWVFVEGIIKESAERYEIGGKEND